jgi:hypothetical protein
VTPEERSALFVITRSAIMVPVSTRLGFRIKSSRSSALGLWQRGRGRDNACLNGTYDSTGVVQCTLRFRLTG